MKCIIIIRKDNEIILNIDKIIKIESYIDTTFCIDIYHQYGSKVSIIHLSYLNEKDRNEDYNRLKDFLFCLNENINCFTLVIIK